MKICPAWSAVRKTSNINIDGYTVIACLSPPLMSVNCLLYQHQMYIDNDIHKKYDFKINVVDRLLKITQS